MIDTYYAAYSPEISAFLLCSSPRALLRYIWVLVSAGQCLWCQVLGEFL